MPILVLTEVFPPKRGGSGRWFWELYRRLPLDVQVLAGRVEGAEAFDAAQTLPIGRAPLTFPSWGIVSFRGLAAYVRAWRQLSRTIRSIRPQAIHCGKALPEGALAWVAAMRWKVPYCCYVHGEELRLAHESRDLTWLTRRVLARASLIVANTKHTQTVPRDEWDCTRQVAVMHPGVDATRFVPAAADPARRAAMGWAGRTVILTVGAFQKRKGQDMMIRALPAIRARHPAVLYVMAGEGWERPYLEELAVTCGVQDAVQFIDVPQDDRLIELYQQCDLFALPNRQVGWDIEGFGIVLIEAQACGKAVVAGRSGGTGETLVPDVTGALVPCETPEPLAAAVNALLDDPTRLNRMGEAARDWVEQQFDWSVLTRQAVGLFAVKL